MLKLTVQRNRLGPVRGRHPWVFSGALKGMIPEGLESGMPVMLEDEAGGFLASGYFNSYSQIAVRVWSWEENEEANQSFFERRIKLAYELRQEYVENKKTNAYRLVNSENDLLPGLIVDKYDDYLVTQFHNRGINFWKDTIVDALVKVIKPKGVFERSDVGNRMKEMRQTFGGAKSAILREQAELPKEEIVKILYGKVPEKIKILENGFKFAVDVANGQKTGFFLDQRDKRAALMKYCKNKKVLNCFSYTGGFSVYALGAGAKKVVSVDVSENALKMAEENCLLNGFKENQAEFIQADVKDYLADPIHQLAKEKFDVIILDPPAFVKDRHKVREGLMGYRKINEAAIRILPPNGILVTASCSQHVSLNDFRFMLSEAAGRAGRTVQVLETFTHGIDHPELMPFVEGEYLKCIFARVI